MADIPWDDVFNDYVRGAFKIDRTGRRHYFYTYEQLGEKYNCHWGTIANYAKKNGWKEKKKVFQASKQGDEQYFAQLAAGLGGDIIAISSKILEDIKDEVYEGKYKGKPIDLAQRRLNNAKTIDIIQKMIVGIIQIEENRIKESDVRANATKLSREERIKKIEEMTKQLEKQKRK